MPGNINIGAFVGNKQLATSVSMIDGGLFVIDSIPRFRDSDYTLQLRITDPNKVFLQKNVDVSIQRDSGVADELSAGTIRLLTNDGNVCAVGNNTCIDASTLQAGQFVFNVKDGNQDQIKSLSNAQIQITEGFTNLGPLVKTIYTDETGTAKITGIPYGSYLATYTKPGYYASSSRLDLQEPSQNPIPIILRPVNDTNEMRIIADMNDPSVDLDLKMNVKSDKGTQCQVSPYNKYCAYSSHLNDVVQGTGQEVIGIKRLSVAEYLTFISPAPAYSGNC